MAKVKSNVIGNFSGRIGSVSARIINGITHIVSRPVKFKTSYSPKSKAARDKFARTINFTTNILSIPELKTIWERANLKGKYLRSSMFNYNYHFFENGEPGLLNVITPGGFLPPVENVIINENDIQIEFGYFTGCARLKEHETCLTFICSLVYYNPVNKHKTYLYPVNFIKQVENYNFYESYSLRVNINKSGSALNSFYNNSILYTAVVTKNDYGGVIQNSATYAHKIK